jgi:hypothetical protein
MTEEQIPIAPAVPADPYPWIKKPESNTEPLLPSETVNPIGHVIYPAANVEIKEQPNVK